MKRSTKIAPVSLSTSYLIGSACIGISMMTLRSSGTLRPALTRSRLTGERALSVALVPREFDDAVHLLHRHRALAHRTYRVHVAAGVGFQFVPLAAHGAPAA